MNKCIFCGNLTKDFEISETQGGLKVGRCSMALNRGKDKNGNDKGADYINLVAFDKKADLMQSFGTKGKKFLFECHVQTGSYDKDGKKVYTTDFVIDSIHFIDSKASGESKQTASAEAKEDEYIEVPAGIDEELPFR